MTEDISTERVYCCADSIKNEDQDIKTVLSHVILKLCNEEWITPTHY